MSLLIDEFLMLRQSMPVIDVRSEGEYAEGHVAEAFNIPILSDAERKEVGTDYKQKGRHDAIMTGFRLVGPRLGEIVAETEKVSAGRDIIVHCWRGGMRSANYCKFVGMAGVRTLSLEGGYKTYRQKAIESFGVPLQLVVIGGCTGSGKTDVIRALKANGEQVLDLEGIASHRGSAFGALMLPPQPTTEQFQNNLFEAIHKLDPTRRVWVEDESIAIGRVFLPQPLWNQMISSPVIELDVPKEGRIKRLVNEYGAADKEEFLAAMVKITRKLGGQHFKAAKEKLLVDDMTATIDILLTYYDRAYRTGLTGKKHRIKQTCPWDGDDPHAFAATLKEIVPFNLINA